MSFDRYRELVTQMCGVVNIPDAAAVLARGAVEIDGYEVLLTHFENDPEAMYRLLQSVLHPPAAAV